MWANGRVEEALQASERAVELASEHERDFYQGNLDRMRTQPDTYSEAYRLETKAKAALREAYVLNEEAWKLVDPDRNDLDSDVGRGKALARAAVALAPKHAGICDTLAWALFANGLHDEALVESSKALELADEDRKEDYQGYLDRMRAMIEEARSDPPTSDLPGDDQ